MPVNSNNSPSAQVSGQHFCPNAFNPPWLHPVMKYLIRAWATLIAAGIAGFVLLELVSKAADVVPYLYSAALVILVLAMAALSFLELKGIANRGKKFGEALTHSMLFGSFTGFFFGPISVFLGEGIGGRIASLFGSEPYPFYLTLDRLNSLLHSSLETGVVAAAIAAAACAVLWHFKPKKRQKR